jgi:hypothetical protein
MNLGHATAGTGHLAAVWKNRVAFPRDCGILTGSPIATKGVGG